MKVDTRTISRFDAAIMLRAKLGYLRENWDDFLADCVRGVTSIKGIRLLPCATKRGARGYNRPVYGVDSVEKFIADVKAKIPAAGKTPVTSIMLAIDTRKSWQLNKFASDGSPIAMSRVASFVPHGHSY